MNRSSSITEVKGIGAKTQESFEKIGVYTVGDILLHFPKTYIQYPRPITFPLEEPLAEGMCAIQTMLMRAPVVKKTAKLQLTMLTIGDSIDSVQVVWYRMPYLKNSLLPGKQYVFYGRMVKKSGKLTLEHPAIYTLEQYESMVEQFFPVYSLTDGISNNLITKTIRQILTEDALFTDYLPQEIRTANHLCEYNYAIKQIHFPDDMDTLIEVRKRLVFDEFFLFIMGMQYQKMRQEKERNRFSFVDRSCVSQMLSKLPYTLTKAQLRALGEIMDDMDSPYVMQRLIQGDVGSGKTILAFLMMARTSLSGYQSAIMAPTEVLAKQHYESYCRLCETFALDCEVLLLTGSMTQKEKRIAYEKMENCSNAMIVGTHALIQEKSIYSNLALVITDEQHRFGVHQRDSLSEKGQKPHILVMSATPIPRTLAIIIYGDMDISVIDEVPANRLPIKNCVVNRSYRPKAYSFLLEQIRQQHQGYVICPLVEETENLDAENVEDYARMLREYYGGKVSVGVLHGKMKNDKKNEVMERFSKNEIQVLVSTTVVEVGVNVPNATVMMIENADRFGLAQLHQLRGRVGRGDAQSYCIMVNTSNSKMAQKRLETLNHSNDGFFIASEDLKLRGPGDFFGIRQSGELAFRIGDIYQDADVLKMASEAVAGVLDKDPKLQKEEHAALAREMKCFMDEQIKKMNL